MTKVYTVRLPDLIGKKIRMRADLEHRTISEQIKKYLYDALLCEENPDIPLSFLRETLNAKEEVKAGMCEEYRFGPLE
jgi:plasmid stability protein